MYLSEIFEHLTYGELSTLKIGGLEKGGIQPESFPQVISFINMAMIDIYRKFLIVDKNVTIEQFDNILEYSLTYEHAQSNLAPVDPAITRYIADTGYNTPFTEDVLQIHSAYQKNFEELPLNDLNERTSIFTIADDMIQIPYPAQGEFIDLIYHANPEKIPLDTTACDTLKVRLPQQFLSALLAYVGYRAHISLPAGNTSKSTEHLGRYLGICNDIRLIGTFNKPNLSNLKLLDRGFKDTSIYKQSR